MEKGLNNVKDKNIKIPINIIDSPRRKYSVFIGATVVANAYNVPGEPYWITKLEHPVALAHVMDVQSDEVAGIVHIVLLETGHRGILIGDILLCI